MLPCHVIRDLLPQYIEKLTDKQTDALIEEHLAGCPGCRGLKEEMEAALPLQKAAAPKLAFLKKLRRRSQIGALLSILITLLCLILLYRLEYIDVADTAALAQTLEGRYGSGSNKVTVLMTKKEGRDLFVLYQNERAKYGDVRYGVEQMRQGLFGGYRFLAEQDSSWPLYSTMLANAGTDRQCLVIYGANPIEGAASFRFYRPNGEGWNNPQLDMTGVEPFYEADTAAPMLAVIPYEGESAGFWGYQFIYFYDAFGRPLDTKALAESQFLWDGSTGGGGSGPSSLTPFLFWCGLTAALGALFVRYFIKP